MLLFIGAEDPLPRRLFLGAALADRLEVRGDVIRDVEGGLQWVAERLLRLRYALGTERRAVNAEGVRLRRAEADDRAGADERGALRLSLRRRQCGTYLVGIHAVDLLHVPADSAEASRNVLRERQADGAGQRDLVLVVEIDQLAQPEMTGERGGLGGDPFHQVAVGDDAVDVVVDDIEPRAVEGRGQEPLGDGHANAIGEALPQGTSGDIDPRGMQALRMTGRLGAKLAEVLQLVERQIIASDVQQAVEQGRTVAGGENEAVAIRPFRFLRIEVA